MSKVAVIMICSMLSLSIVPMSHAAVFAEVASGSYCPDSPATNEILFDMFNSEQYDFYYVTMVGDKNEKAYDRLSNDYNFYWYPTVFFDGGTTVVLESNTEAYANAINDIKNKPKPNVHMETAADWVCSECGTGMLVTVNILNRDSTPYNGMLRIYIAEVNARWKDYNANQYHFAFLDFAMKENVTLQPNDEIILSANWLPEDIYPDINEDDMNNLAVFAVLFNTTSSVNYANPPSDNPFDAFSVDNVSAVIPENSPPSVSIISPKENYLYLFDREIVQLPRTIIIGEKTVSIASYDENGIEKIEVYVDSELRDTLAIDETWTWRDTGKHTLRIVAYDGSGLTADDAFNAFIIA